MPKTQEKPQSHCEVLRASLYQKLIDDLDAQVPEYFRIPGIEDGVRTEGVEIYAMRREKGTRALIAIPICIREDATFRRASHNKIRFMFCKAKININSLEDLEREWPKIIEIIKQGESLLYYHQDKISPYILRPNQVEEQVSRPLSSQEKINQAAAIGLIIGLTIGWTMGWENTKELTEYLVQQGIFDINKDVQEILNKLAAAQINAENFGERAFLRTTLATPLALITSTIGSVVAAVKEVIRKPKT